MIESSTNGKKRNALDKLITMKLCYQLDVYPAEILEAQDAEYIVLCGDLHGNNIEAHGKAVALASRKLSIEQQMVESADTQMKAKEEDGAVLLARLWKTERTDLEQALRIFQKLGGNVFGVAMIE